MKRILPIILLLCSQAFAGNWYVRKGAAGANNGTDWTNAWSDFNNIAFTSVACGDTIWIAGNNGGTAYTGSMSGFKTCTSGTVVNIKRVTASDAVPAAAAGWLSTFDTQVVINNTQTTMSGNWWMVDGRTGDAQSNVAYGILYNNSNDGWLGVFANNSAGSITGITLSHIEIHGPACVASGNCGGTNWALRLDAGGATGITVDHSWFHRFGEVIHGPTNAASNFVLQYSYIGEDVKLNPVEHEDWLYTADPCGKMTFNANTWYSSGNDGIFMDFNGCNNGFVFTNNVVMAWGGWSIEFGKTGTCGPFTIVNNTFANNGLGSDGAGTEFTFGFMNDGGCSINTASVATNNLTYNMTIGDFTNTEATFNAGTRTNGFNFSCGTGCFQYAIASPIQNFTGFVNFTAAGTPYSSAVVQSDLHLSSAGKTLFQGFATNLTSQCGTFPTFCTDRDGKTRPVSGNWTVGAFEPLACALGSSWKCWQRPGDGSNGEQEVYQNDHVSLVGGGGAQITETNTPSSTQSGTYLSADVPTGSFISCTGSGNPGTYSCTSTYTSGGFQTATFNQQYGDWQVNWKAGNGWPAVWLLGVNCQSTTPAGPDNVGTCNWDSPQSSEIDICEGHLVAAGSTSYLQNAFNNTVGDFTGSVTGLTDITTNSHTCEVVLTSGSITWKVDGVTTNTKAGNYSDNFFLIIQNAIGGNNGGVPTNFSYPNTSTINWVKVCTTACSNGTAAAAASNGAAGLNSNGFDAFSTTATVATPTFSPVAGTYGAAQTVTITSSTTSATICYTVDGTTPTANGAGVCTAGTTLANGGTVSVSTSQTVQAMGSLSGDTDSGVGSATYTIGIPSASLLPSSLSFGGVNNSNTSAPQTLTLQNTGTAAMSITSISLTGANTGDFFQSNNCPVGSNLGNGASCTITVTFTPLAVGARSASVSVVDGASGSPHTSTLSGTGVQASISGQMNPGVRMSGRATVK